MNTSKQHPQWVDANGGDEAERWFMRMQGADCSADERAACRNWLAASPHNAAAYAQVERLYRLSGDFALDSEKRTAAREVRLRAERAGRIRRRMRWGASLGTAAVLALAVGIGWLRWDPAQPERQFATALGERSAIVLDDGSRVQLDTDSAVTVRYSRKRRDVLLDRGRAQFEVMPSSRRPFTVRVDAGVVRAIGTEFQVYRRDTSVLVTLLEGAVSVSLPPQGDGSATRTATLASGERLAFGPDGLWRTDVVDPDTAQGWTRGELVFRQRPLLELLEESNRYTAGKIRIGDPSLGELRVSGVFDSDDQASLLQALEHVLSLRAERVSADEIVLHRR